MAKLISLRKIRGQDNVIGEISQRLANETMQGSFLFTGPDGIGKRTTALAIVAALFCTERNGCGSCPACQQISAGTHPDCLVLAPDEKETIKIDAARELVRRMNLKPSQAPQNIAIIDRCDTLTTEASNALLKAIEEPNGTFILISSRPGSLLATIRSRCQQLHFRPLATDILADLLRETYDFSEEQCGRIIPLAEGSLDQAQLFGQWLSDLDVSLDELFKELATTPYTRLEERLMELPTDPQGIACLLSGLRLACRNHLIKDERQGARWFACLDAISEAEAALRQKTSPKLLWETLAFSFQRSKKHAA